jgi:hypothetical protein
MGIVAPSIITRELRPTLPCIHFINVIPETVHQSQGRRADSGLRIKTFDRTVKFLFVTMLNYSEIKPIAKHEWITGPALPLKYFI